jgi:hypothetical protein
MSYMQTKTYKSSLITLSGIDAAQDKIKCPPDSFNADFCAGPNRAIIIIIIIIIIIRTILVAYTMEQVLK